MSFIKRRPKPPIPKPGPIKPCPCCDRDIFYWGPLDHFHCGVRCECGLQMALEMPLEWPQEMLDIWKRDGFHAAQVEMRKLVTAQAVELWNKRGPKPIIIKKRLHK